MKIASAVARCQDYVWSRGVVASEAVVSDLNVLTFQSNLQNNVRRVGGSTRGNLVNKRVSSTALRGGQVKGQALTYENHCDLCYMYVVRKQTLRGRALPGSGSGSRVRRGRVRHIGSVPLDPFLPKLF